MSRLGKVQFRSLALLLVLASSSHGAFAQANCETYGKLALRQMQENELKKCGFKGLEWNTDLKAHVDWCASVGPDQWKAQLQKRELALATCIKK